MPASLKVQATRMPRFTAICQHVANGMSFKAAAGQVGMAHQTALEWLVSAPERAEMADMLTHAREAQAGGLVDQIVPLADGATRDDVQQRRLQVDARVRVAPLLAPRKYGKHVNVDVAVQTLVAFTDMRPLQVEATVERVVLPHVAAPDSVSGEAE